VVVMVTMWHGQAQTPADVPLMWHTLRQWQTYRRDDTLEGQDGERSYVLQIP
jgi:hypothetical protein